jgi:hypothetical protein
MKLLLLTGLIFTILFVNGQDKFIHLKGKIVDEHSHPIPDAYIINYRDYKKIVSNRDGEFNIWVERSDSLMISHISYYRKIVYTDSVRLHPTIQLKLDTVNIMHINVFTESRTDEDFAKKNINSWEFSLKPSPTEVFTEKERVQNVINSENKVMRSEASSVRIATFSPSEQIGKIVNLFKRRKKSNEFSNSKKRK